MTDPSSQPSLADLQGKLLAFNQARDWGQFHSPRNLAMALSVEAGEVLELFLWSKDGGPQPPLEGRSNRLKAELADVLICLLNLAQHAEIDMTSAFAEKLSAIEKKYPAERVRGDMRKYDEYDDEPNPE